MARTLLLVPQGTSEALHNWSLGDDIQNKGVVLYIQHLVFALQYVCLSRDTMEERHNPSHLTWHSGPLVEPCAFREARLILCVQNSQFGDQVQLHSLHQQYFLHSHL